MAHYPRDRLEEIRDPFKECWFSAPPQIEVVSDFVKLRLKVRRLAKLEAGTLSLSVGWYFAVASKSQLGEFDFLLPWCFVITAGLYDWPGVRI